MLALILAVAAGICLGCGWWTGQVVLVYAALGTSAAGLVLVLVQAWRRKAARKAAATGETEETEEVSEHAEDITDEADDEEDEDEGNVVFVLPGRKRFHVAGCRLLEGRAAQQLTLAEAEEESFTPCTVCAEHTAELVGR